VRARQPVNFQRVAAAAGVSPAWLYKHADVKARIAALRDQGTPHPPVAPAQRASDASKDALLACSGYPVHPPGIGRGSRPAVKFPFIVPEGAIDQCRADRGARREGRSRPRRNREGSPPDRARSRRRADGARAEARFAPASSP